MKIEVEIKKILTFGWKRIVWPALIVLLIYIVTMLVWAGVLYVQPAKKFHGSPEPACQTQRSHLNFNERGWFIEKFFKFFRARIPIASKYATTFTPGWGPTHWLLYSHTGWTVLTGDEYNSQYLPCAKTDNPNQTESGSCICITGIVKSQEFSDGDGDYNGYIIPDEPFQGIIHGPGIPPKDKPDLTTEIDAPLRDNFPILRCVSTGDRVRLCGSHVIDRAHDFHKEIHPITWIEIIGTSTRADAEIPPAHTSTAAKEGIHIRIQSWEE